MQEKNKYKHQESVTLTSDNTVYCPCKIDGVAGANNEPKKKYI